MVTPVYATGFEHGAALVSGAGNGLAVAINGSGTHDVTSAAARSGGYGLRMTQTAGQGFHEVVLYQIAAQVHVGAFYWRPTVKPTTHGKDICFAFVGSGFVGFYFDPTVDKVKAFVSDGTTTVEQAADTTQATNVYYRIDFIWTTNGATWTIDWKINGVTQAQASEGGNAAANMVNFVISGNDTTVADATGNTFDYDDIVLSATSGDFPIGNAVVLGITADQAAAAEHQGITAAEWQYTDDFSAFTNFSGASETDSRSRLDDLNTSDGVRLAGADITTQPVFRAAGAKSVGTTSAVTVSAPTGIATGDLEILIAETTTTCSITNNGGGSWTAMTNSPVAAPTGGRALYIWWRIRAGGDGDPQVTAATDQVCACRICYQAGTFDTDTPFELTTPGTEHTTPSEDTSFSTGALGSTSGANRVVGCVATILRDSNTASVPQMTNANLANPAVANHSVNYNTTSGNGGGFGFTDGGLAAAGAAGTFACTYAVASGKSWLAFAIRPASGPGGAITGNGRWPVADPVQHPSAQVLAVSCLTSIREAAAGTNDLTMRTLVGASTINHFTGDPGEGTTWNYIRSIMATKPGGGSWTIADVNAIKFEVDSTDCSPAHWLGGFVYEVVYAGGKSKPRTATRQSVPSGPGAVYS